MPQLASSNRAHRVFQTDQIGVDLGPFWKTIKVGLLSYECPNLLHLEMHGYEQSLSSLQSILALLPDLESLKIDDDGYKREDVVLEHSRLKYLFLESSSVQSLILVMPSLVHVDIGDSFIEVLKVFSMAKTVTIDFDRSFQTPMVRRKVFPGGRMRKVDLSDAK